MGDIRLEKDAVIDAAALKARGISPHHIDKLLNAGRLHRVERGVYTTSPPTGTLLLRALAHRRPKLVYTGKTAIELYSGREITQPVTARVPRGASTVGTAQLNVRQSRRLRARWLEGVRVVSPLAAVADHLDHDESDLIRFLEQTYRHRAGKQLLGEHLDMLSRVPHRLSRLIRHAAIGSDSDAERTVFGALKKQGIAVVQNHNIGGYFFDGVIPKSRLIVEIDGYQYHSAENRTTFVLDRWKSNYATRHGYRVLRYSGSCVKYHLTEIVDQVIAAATDDPAHLDTETHPVWRWHNTLLRDGPWMEEVAQ